MSSLAAAHLRGLKNVTEPNREFWKGFVFLVFEFQIGGDEYLCRVNKNGTCFCWVHLVYAYSFFNASMKYT